MAAATQERSGSSGGGCVLILLLAGAVMMGFLALMGSNLSTADIPDLNDHAKDKHGQQAMDAWT